jgi:hypothetical protein
MIIGMIMAHPTDNRMARRAMEPAAAALRRQAADTPGPQACEAAPHTWRPVNDNAPSADRILCRGRAGERVAPPRASVSDGRQPTEREVEAAVVGGLPTSQGRVWIRIASSGRADEPGQRTVSSCQFGLAGLVSAGRRADAARLGGLRQGPLGPTSAGPSAAAAQAWRRQPQVETTGASRGLVI